MRKYIMYGILGSVIYAGAKNEDAVGNVLAGAKDYALQPNVMSEEVVIKKVTIPSGWFDYSYHFEFEDGSTLDTRSWTISDIYTGVPVKMIKSMGTIRITRTPEKS